MKIDNNKKDNINTDEALNGKISFSRFINIKNKKNIFEESFEKINHLIFQLKTILQKPSYLCSSTNFIVFSIK